MKPARGKKTPSLCWDVLLVLTDDKADRRLLGGGGGGGSKRGWGGVEELPKIVLALCRQYPSSDAPTAGAVLDPGPRCDLKSLVSIWISLKCTAEVENAVTLSSSPLLPPHPDAWPFWRRLKRPPYCRTSVKSYGVTAGN